jgi:hypothetical protein
MDKILIIDGGGKGNRVKDIVSEIRKNIPSDKLIIRYSISNIDENGNYHDLSGYRLALIHDNDNVDNYGKPIFNIIAKDSGTRLILYSGGFSGFNQDTSSVCKINDNLLKMKISGFLEYLIKIHFIEIDFRFLYPGEKYIYLDELFNIRLKLFTLLCNTRIGISDENFIQIKKYLENFENHFYQLYDGTRYSLFKKFVQDNIEIKENYMELINKINISVFKIESQYE